jgi:ribosome-binding factor A
MFCNHYRMNESRRQHKVAEEITHQGGEFVARYAKGGGALITVTRSIISPDLKRVTVFFTVIPESKQDESLKTLKRLRTDFHDFLKEKTVLRNVPTVDFEVDLGEQNRQRIDELTRQ